MADEPDPPRKFYQLKPREFEQLNERSPSLPGAPKSPPSPPGAKIDVRDHYQHARTAGPVLPIHRAATQKNDVHVILEDNLAQANAGGLNELTPKPRRRSRRTRDYIIVAGSLDAFFAFAAFGPYSNVALMAYGVAGIIICTVGLAWIMFAVMEDY